MGAMVLAIASCFLHQVAILSIRSLVTKHHTLLQPGAKGKRIATARKPDEADSARQNVLRRPPPRDHTGESPVPQTPAAQTPAAGATDSSRRCHRLQPPMPQKSLVRPSYLSDRHSVSCYARTFGLGTSMSRARASGPICVSTASRIVQSSTISRMASMSG